MSEENKQANFPVAISQMKEEKNNRNNTSLNHKQIKRSRMTYALLALFTGAVGGHNFYAKQKILGCIKLSATLLFCWTMIIPLLMEAWALIEMTFTSQPKKIQLAGKRTPAVLIGVLSMIFAGILIVSYGNGTGFLAAEASNAFLHGTDERRTEWFHEDGQKLAKNEVIPQEIKSHLMDQYQAFKFQFSGTAVSPFYDVFHPWAIVDHSRDVKKYAKKTLAAIDQKKPEYIEVWKSFDLDILRKIAGIEKRSK